MRRQLFEYHPTIGYRFIPGLRVRVEHEAGGYLVQVNQAGFRSQREFALTKPQGVFRVLLFGDSFTAGDGVSNKHRYSEQLEAERPGLEIYNYGLPGTGTDQQYLAYTEFAREVPCDLIVIAVLVENIRRVVARYRSFLDDTGKPALYAKPYFTRAADGELTLCGVPVPKAPVEPEAAEVQQHADHGGSAPLLRRAVNLLGPSVKQLAQRVSGYQPVPGFDQPGHPDWLLLRSLLQQWIRQAHAPVLLFPLPLYQHVEGTASAAAYQQRFAELATETGVQVCDPLPQLLKLSREEQRQLRFASDVHPTPFAHSQYARALAPVLAALQAQTRTGNAP